eukprot:4450552-Amphidinium_carterae.1
MALLMHSHIMPKQKKKKSPGPTSAFGDTSGFGDFPAFGDWPGDVAQQAGGGGFEDFGKSAAAADAELEHDAGRAAVANALRAESMSSELAGLRASLKSLTQVNEKLKATSLSSDSMTSNFQTVQFWLSVAAD